jgi:membrane protein DedA with SNARE-associated domain
MDVTLPAAGLTTAVTQGTWAYVIVFLVVALSSAGVPAIGALALGSAAVAAAHGELSIVVLLVVSVIAGEVGGIAGYEAGRRWGRPVMERPGRRLAGRRAALVKGEQLYAKWGRLAVFFTKSPMAGIARMKFSQFVLWKFFAVLAFVLSVGPAAYGTGELVSGTRRVSGVSALVGGLVIAGVVTVLFIRYRRRRDTLGVGTSDDT